MTTFSEHHLIALLSICNASLELVSVIPETDINIELKNILEYNYDILDCLINGRHFGSDSLDHIIHECHSLIEQVKIMEA